MKIEFVYLNKLVWLLDSLWKQWLYENLMNNAYSESIDSGL